MKKEIKFSDIPREKNIIGRDLLCARISPVNENIIVETGRMLNKKELDELKNPLFA